MLTADRARAFGWHIEFLLKPQQLVDLAPRMMALSCPISVDHLGLLDPAAALDQPAFVALQALLRQGHGWVKFSGAYRVARRTEQYEAVLPFARRLAQDHPDRIVWGSDWPHVGQMEAMPNTTRLLDLLTAWAPGESERRRILVDNPATLYGFDA